MNTSPIAASTQPAAAPQPDDGLRQRRTTPRATTVESDHSDCSTEVDELELPALPDPTAVLAALDEVMQHPRLQLHAPHRHPLTDALKTGWGQAGLVATVGAGVSTTHAMLVPDSDGYAQAVKFAELCCAGLVAAATHGSVVYGVDRPTQNNVIWRAISLGCAAGLVGADFRSLMRGTTPVLVPGLTYTPATLLHLTALMLTTAMTRERPLSRLYHGDCEIRSLLQQLISSIQLTFALSACAGHVGRFCQSASAPKTDAPSAARQWANALSHPRAALSLAATAGAVAVVVGGPQLRQGRPFYAAMAPQVGLLGCIAALHFLREL